MRARMTPRFACRAIPSAKTSPNTLDLGNRPNAGISCPYCPSPFPNLVVIWLITITASSRFAASAMSVLATQRRRRVRTAMSEKCWRKGKAIESRTTSLIWGRRVRWSA